jgi:hypothetical protein
VEPHVTTCAVSSLRLQEKLRLQETLCAAMKKPVIDVGRLLLYH